MPDNTYFLSMLSDPGFAVGRAIWNACVEALGFLLHTSPEGFQNGEPWSLVVSELYPVFLIIGASLMNLFFAIGFFRESADLRQNITLEKTIMLFIRVILANFLLVNGLSLLRLFWEMADFADFSFGERLYIREFAVSESINPQNLLLYWAIGLFFVLCAVVCGLFLLWSVYRRFLQLFLLLVFSPIAFSSFAGERRISAAGVRWLQNFLYCCLELLVISLSLLLAGAMLGNGITLNLSETAQELEAPLQAAFVMLLVSGAVRGAEEFLRKIFEL